MNSRIFGTFFLAVGVLLFLAVAVAGPAWVTEHVILRIVSLPEDVPPRPLEEAPVTWEEVSEIVTPERVEAHVRAMSEIPSRVVGYPGNRAAMEYVVDAFHAGGLTEVAVDTFTVSSPVDHGFTLTVHDSVETEIPVYQFWPNLVRLNSFPDGIRGPCTTAGGASSRPSTGRRSRGASSWSISTGATSISTRGCSVPRLSCSTTTAPAR